MSLSLTPAARAPDTDSGPLEIGFATGECSLGTMLVARTSRGVCAILLGDDAEALARDLGRRFPTARVRRDSGTDAMLETVTRLIESPGLELYLPLDLRGHAVSTARYGRPSGRSPPARPRATPRSPAHRRAGIGTCRGAGLRGQPAGGGDSLPSRGAQPTARLSGYRWGVERKRALLAREAQA